MKAECKLRPRAKTAVNKTCMSCKLVGWLYFTLSCKRVDAFNVIGNTGSMQMFFEFVYLEAGSLKSTELLI